MMKEDFENQNYGFVTAGCFEVCIFYVVRKIVVDSIVYLAPDQGL
jgi:hypothetical protein